ncbi:hypothetical protein GGS24DRAFT_499159 [Hypoxylon argillaceum]|nr:hypothetical protein GGS24DRAFT_499159 [Hypoxylon argillaceum]
MAIHRSSRADAARVESTIALIRSTLRLRHTTITNPRRKLNARQYGQLLRTIRDSGDTELQAYSEDKLRFDYTRSQQRFEIRIRTIIHEMMAESIFLKVGNWVEQLQGSDDTKVSNAARSVMWAGSTDVEFPFAKGENDSKSPDKSFIHTQCGCQCVFPTVVVEVGFSQRNNDLQEKAEAYIRRSNGEIRAVVGVDMYKMFQAEKRNELRLKKKYMAGELDGTGSYVYAKDENNETAEGSIVVWRPTFGRGGKKFRDEKGKPTDSVPLHLPLQDFICKAVKDSPAGSFEAPPLELVAEDVCLWVDRALKFYRTKRSQVVKEKAGRERQEKQEKDKK